MAITRRHLSGLVAGAAALAALPAAARRAVAAAAIARRKVIFDTDPGIDDAMALLLLQALPQVELLAITTTFGNATIETTTRNALYLAERFGIDVPVAQGRGTPLVGAAEPPPTQVHGLNGLGDIPLPARIGKAKDPRTAQRLIIDMLRAHPGEVTLVAVGRLTNLAMALEEAPEIAGLAQQLVIMGGAFGYGGVLGNVTPAAEANIHGDPTAADLVFGAAWPVVIVGLDVTHRVEMSQDYLRELKDEAGDIGRFIWDISRLYENFYRSRGNPSIYVHDASAVAYLADPGLFKTRSGAVRVVQDGLALGETIQKPESRRFPPGAWDDRPVPQVCIDVDAEGVRKLFRQRIVALAGGKK